jgi:type II secretory ATPase GspE/PulE/Tfp pilus assembly ATPase PilB-like protein
LRHDPDVLLVGEVRDAESAESIKNIVLAGRKVLATLHAYDAMAAWSRLTQIGVPADVLFMSGFVSGIIYQRLLPKLCQHCALDYETLRDQGKLPAPLVERIERVFMMGSSRLKLHNPDGCPHCKSGAPGYKGRVVCAEYVVPDQLMLDALREGRHQAAKNQWMAMPSDTGFGATAIAHALMMMAEGLVDPRDVESQVGVIRLPQVSLELAASNQPGGSSLGGSGRGRELPVLSGSNVLSMDGASVDLEDLYERSVA